MHSKKFSSSSENVSTQRRLEKIAHVGYKTHRSIRRFSLKTVTITVFARSAFNRRSHLFALYINCRLLSAH